MTADDVIAAKDGDGWAPTPRLLALWRAAGGLQPLPARLTLADRSRLPTAVFLGVFGKAFGTGLQPLDAVVTREGKPTEDFLTTARGVGL